MAENAGRFNWVTRMALTWAILMLVALGLTLLVSTVLLIDNLRAGGPLTLVLYWVILLVGLAAGAIGAWVLYGLACSVVTIQQSATAGVERLQRLESVLEALHVSTDRLVDLAPMSDAAKSLLFRQREIEAMNELLHEYLIRQDYAKAEALVNDIEKRLGFAEQVQAMRKEIQTNRSTTVDQKADAAMERVSALIEARDWERAMRQANRLVQLLPNSPKISPLPQMVRDARAKQKRDLLEAYGEAVKAGDIDRSIALLHELDPFLAPQEAAALEDSARGVFRAKLHNLGVQFAIRVTEQQWPEAVAIGEQIVREYPNTRMAQEVAEKMDRLRALAAGKVQRPPQPPPVARLSK